MQRQGKKQNGFDMDMGKVVSVNPVSISYNNVLITSGIILGGCMQASDDLEQIITKEQNISTELKEVLKSISSTIKLQPGDEVILQRVGNKFYIVGKAG